MRINSYEFNIYWTCAFYYIATACSGFGGHFLYRCKIKEALKKYNILLSQFNAEQFNRVATIVNSLDEIISKRTGLSNELYLAALGLSDEDNSKYEEEVAEFLSYLVDSSQQILSKFTGAKCAVSIKVFVPDQDDDNKPKVVTLYRDSVSSVLRNNIYEKFEPFKYDRNSIFAELMNSSPQKSFVQYNNLHDSKLQYQSQYADWEKIQNASAVHLIKNPNSIDKEDVYGFLCCDNLNGGFDNKITRDTMSIVANMIYYCISASSVVEISKEKLGNR